MVYLKNLVVNYYPYVEKLLLSCEWVYIFFKYNFNQKEQFFFNTTRDLSIDEFQHVCRDNIIVTLLERQLNVKNRLR